MKVWNMFYILIHIQSAQYILLRFPLKLVCDKDQMKSDMIP